MRINKYLAQALGMSRREADDYLSANRVTLNGRTAVIGNQVSTDDEVAVDGNKVQKVGFVYIALHKPINYVCSKKKQGKDPTIYELLPEKYQTLKTVGRLDKNSSGIILLTNDGDFAQHMTHPKFRKEKQYQVTLDSKLSASDVVHLGNGVGLEDGMSKLVVEDVGGSYLVTMHEGRNRQIRRTFETLGYKVTRLHRIKFGDYSLGDLEEGQTKEFNLA